MELCISPEEHNSHLQPYLQMLYLMIIGSLSFFLSGQSDSLCLPVCIQKYHVGFSLYILLNLVH